MANREKGEATFSVGEKTYTIVVDTTAWAVAQNELSKGADVPAMELMTARLSANHMMTILAVFYGSLQKHHGRVVQDQRTATGIFERSKGAAAEALAKAIGLSAPDSEDLKELGVTANPPKAQGGKKKPAGTGDESVSRHAAPV